MEQAVNKIMQCIDDAYTVEESEKEILRFGIQSAIELAINILLSIFILLKMHMIWEGFLFFGIFIPIRSLAGGYHSDTYLRCLLFSMFTLIGIMVISCHVKIPINLSLITIFLFGGVISRISPVVNAERPISKREYCIFSRRLKVILFFDDILSLCLWKMQCEKAINIINLSFMLILITLVIGKIKYRSYQISI